MKTTATATDLSKPLLNHDSLISAYASNNKQITVKENILLITFKFWTCCIAKSSNAKK